MSRVKPLDYLANIEPYIPGDFAIEGVSEIVKLSSNESPLGPSKKARDVLKNIQGNLHIYPDSFAAPLTEAIGKKYSLNPQHIVCEAGSEQIINLLARGYAQPGDEILYRQYRFIAYKIAALSVGASPVAAAEEKYTTCVDELLKCVTDRTRILFLANPNNPTGTCIPYSQIQRLRDNLREDILLVLDGAYAEYCHDGEYQDGCALVDTDAGNVVVLHTFSKIYALAGLRIGWAYAPPAITEVLHNLRGVFTVSSAAQVCGVAALSDVAHLESSIAHNDQARAYLLKELAAMGLTVFPSATNFVCVRFADAQEAKAADLLLRQNGYIPRTLDEYGLNDCLRITVGLSRHCEKVIEILSQL